jgi:hypothetical protein
VRADPLGRLERNDMTEDDSLATPEEMVFDLSIGSKLNLAQTGWIVSFLFANQRMLQSQEASHRC